MSASMRLMAIAQVIQKIQVLRKHSCTNQTAAQGNGSIPFYERPGYEATFLATLDQRVEIAISLSEQF